MTWWKLSISTANESKLDGLLSQFGSFHNDLNFTHRRLTESFNFLNAVFQGSLRWICYKVTL